MFFLFIPFTVENRKGNRIRQKHGIYGCFLDCSNFSLFEVVDLSTLSTALIILILFLKILQRK